MASLMRIEEEGIDGSCDGDPVACWDFQLGSSIDAVMIMTIMRTKVMDVVMTNMICEVGACADFSCCWPGAVGEWGHCSRCTCCETRVLI